MQAKKKKEEEKSKLQTVIDKNEAQRKHGGSQEMCNNYRKKKL